jgi:hypothetical protein
VVAALELYFDSAATRRIRGLWDAMEDAGVPSLRDLTHRRHRPHLSLAVAESLDADIVVAALDGLEFAPPLPLTFDHLGQFLGRVLWLGPTPSRSLLVHHAAVYARLSAAGIEVAGQYRPDSWVPHCTLSMRVPLTRLTEAIRLCLDVLPITATVTGAAVADHARGQFQPL